MLACPELNTKKAHSKMGEAFHKASPTRRFIKAYYENNKVYLTKGNQSPGPYKQCLDVIALLMWRLGQSPWKRMIQ